MRAFQMVPRAGRLLMPLLAAFGLFVAVAAPSAARAQDDLGVLVMAHGGGEAWNRSVESMLEPLREDYPLEIAFGMADPNSLQAAVARLEERGAGRIAVVRLFVSGESWYGRTEQILGLAPGAGPRPTAHGGHGGHGGPGGHGGHGGHDMSLWRIETDARFALSTEGLADAPEMGAVLAERVRGLSTDPRRESVLILAHGPGDDAENERWLRDINERAEAVRRMGPFREVRVETLREDWPEKRAEAEARIRAYVADAARDGGRALVIPYRVTGFGPYAKVLEGLDYASDGQGLIPSDEVRHWVRRQIETLEAADFRAPVVQTAAADHAH